MDLKEVEKVVGSIQTQLFKNSNSFSVSMLKSHFKGAGLQFKEHQVYNPGDDVRFIDWKLSAKTNTTFVKTFEEERNVEIHVLLDLSETMTMGYKGVSKLQASFEICCLLYLLAEKTKDKVAVIIATDEILTLPLSCGHEGIAIFISQLQKLSILDEKGRINYQFDYSKATNEKKKFSLLKNLVARGKEVVVLSDLHKFKDKTLLNKLLYRPNLHCFIIQSPLDNAQAMPFTIFGKKLKKTRTARVNRNQQLEEVKGRYKKLNVKERYLEKFIREML